MFNDELAFLRQAFIAGATRGEDSAGAFMVPSADPHSVEWVKKAGEPFHLLYHKDFKDLFERTDKGGRVLVGHNRYATKGSVSDANAHPFNVGPITLVHNGTIHSGLNYPKGIDVDSHALAHALAEEGIEVFSKINGAFACVWHDARTGHLHIAKNYERPLSMIESYGTYFFASEAPMLLWLFHRNQSGYYNNYKKFNSVEIKNNKLYTFNLTADDPVPIEEPLPEKKYYPTTTYQGSTTTCGTTTESSKACGPHKEKRNRKTSRASDDSVTFEIKEVITNDGNKFPYFTYLGLSDDLEGVYFNSNVLLEFEGKTYHGDIRTVEVGRFPDYGANTPWYKLVPRSVIELEPTTKVGDNYLTQSELDDALTRPCLCCDTPVDADKTNLMSALQVSSSRYRLICPACTENDMLTNLTQMYTLNQPIQ